jgi:hypothetical protein
MEKDAKRPIQHRPVSAVQRVRALKAIASSLIRLYREGQKPTEEILSLFIVTWSNCGGLRGGTMPAKTRTLNRL